MNGLLVILSALGGGVLATAISEFMRRKKTDAEVDELSARAVDIITKTAVDLVERTSTLANQREVKLEGKITELETKVDNLSIVVSALTAQLESSGITPVFPKKPPHP